MGAVGRWGKPFKVGKPRAQEMLDNGEARFRRDGLLDMRFRDSRFIARYFPEFKRKGID